MTNEDIIREAFKAVGLPEVILKGADVPETWMVESTDPKHKKVDGEALRTATVAVALADVEGNVTHVSARATSAAHTLKALIDMRTPEEIPA